jgi:GTPase
MGVEELIDGVVAGDRRSVARAISMVEDGASGLPALSAGLFPHTGRAWVVGITGAPGVGKSSLAGALVGSARAAGEERVGVLAIDPTSPFSGGALLGDRVRMQAHATDPGVFIRSMATRGHLGGMALAAPEAVRVLDASGAGLVVVETVGVGQTELDVATATDTTLVVVTPGWGDAVQVAKAGILEVADVFVVNKQERDGAAETVRELETMLRTGGDGDWTPPVVRTSVSEGTGIEELRSAIAAHREYLEAAGAVAPARALRLRREVETIAAELLRRRLDRELQTVPEVGVALDHRRLDPYAAAAALLARVGADGTQGLDPGPPTGMPRDAAGG